jgi:phosphonate transport system substrate-binding protein
VSADARRSPADPALTFVVVSGLPDAEALLAQICGELTHGVGREVRGTVLRSYGEMEAEVAAGRAHLAWAPPRVALDLEDARLGAIALCCTRGGGATLYHAALFTSHASRFEQLADLKGSHAAWVDKHSSAGYLLPRLKLAAEGLDPEDLFARESFLGTHAAVAAAVLAGEADVGATYLHLDRKTGRPVSAGWLDAGAGINGAFILATAGPIPADAIVMADAVSAPDREALARGLRAAATALPEAIGRLLGADGFAAPEPLHFDTLRALLAGRKDR